MKKLFLLFSILFLFGVGISEPPKEDKLPVQAQQYLQELYENDKNFVDLSNNQTIAGIKTFSSIPILPSSNPTADNEATRKTYTDTLPIINTLTEKTTIADNDLFIIEDSEASNAKKKVKKSNISSAVLSNVVFSFAISGVGGPDVVGTIVGDDITSQNNITRQVWAVYDTDTNYHTILTSKFKKIAGISTVTVWCSIWNSANDHSANCKVIIGSVNGNVTGTSGQTSAEWNSFDIDVSSLTNGTTYDVTIQLKNTGDGLSYMDSIIGIAS